MRVFVDTNIFLDLLMEREGADGARRLLNACADGSLEGVVADIMLLNIDYVARQHRADLRAFLALVTERFIVVGADNLLISEALAMPNPDLEDNVQLLCALRSDSAFLITNDRRFPRHDAIVQMGCDAFVDDYLQG